MKPLAGLSKKILSPRVTVIRGLEGGPGLTEA